MRTLDDVVPTLYVVPALLLGSETLLLCARAAFPSAYKWAKRGGGLMYGL